MATGADGSFEFANLVAGTFILSAGGPRYDQTTYRRSQRANAPVRHTLEPGQHFVASIVLTRLGSISGNVLDPFGDPVPGIAVYVLEKKDVSGVKRLVRAGRPVGARMTDDLGQFRLSGLTAGDYYIVALSGLLSAAPSFNVPADAGGFLPTYYPGTPSIAEAQRLQLSTGQDLAGLILTIVPTPMFRVTGVVIDSKGEPLASALVAIVPADGPGLNATIAGRGQADQDGVFALSRVPPGTYVVQARTWATTSSLPGEFGWSTITVGESDVRDVRVSTAGPSTLKGRFVFANEQPLRFVFPHGLKFEMIPTGFDTDSVVAMSSAPTSSRLFGDGRFEIGGLWGRRLMRVRTASSVVERITLEGKDVTDMPIEFNGRDRTGVEVVLNRRSATLIGKVRDADDRPAAGSRVVLFASDSDRWTPHSRFVMTAVADSDGQFRISGISPGSYLSVAVPADVTAPIDEEFLYAVRASATALILGEETTSDVELNLLMHVGR
jgi:protocatechuate 3,4-dioxygenase beta subunit